MKNDRLLVFEDSSSSNEYNITITPVLTDLKVTGDPLTTSIGQLPSWSSIHYIIFSCLFSMWKKDREISVQKQYSNVISMHKRWNLLTPYLPVELPYTMHDCDLLNFLICIYMGGPLIHQFAIRMMYCHACNMKKCLYQ